MVSCLMGDSTALASAIVRCCLRIPKFDTAIELMNALGMSADFALADNLVAAHTTRARYLETLIPSLRPTNQRIMLDTIESVFRTLAEIEKAGQ